MVKIRLRRTGAKKSPSYRVVAAQSTAPRDGRFIENLGHYNPTQDPAEFEVNEERVFHWLSMGAQPTDSVNRLLKSAGLLDKFAQAKTGEQAQTEVVETEAETA